MTKKIKTRFVCQECGYFTTKWMGRCPQCNNWNSFVEEVEKKEDKNLRKTGIGSLEKPVRLSEIQLCNENRFTTCISELDQVLGGGIVEGSLILVGGDPGIGKSTLLLQMANNVASKGKKILYISGEESLKQTKLRADRLKIMSDNLFFVSENDIDIIVSHVKNISPQLLIIDSIQTVHSSDLSSAPGTVSQVREATNTFMNVSKGMGIATFIVGHVTKNGAIAGPKILEHMVDTVLYFEGEKNNVYKILRAVKNRFGSTNELGIFEMTSGGLKEILNPSEIFISKNVKESPGSVITAAMEGTRPILIEIQALVARTNFGMPRRMANGLDYNKVVMLMAVLEKIKGMMIQDQDGYINVVGGMTLNEPAADLAVISAIASSFLNVTIKKNVVLFGEVGLTGEIRAVSMADQRINEAKKMGFKKCIIPKENLKNLNADNDIEIEGVENISDVFSILF
ncbi:DNA repair protein RadA [Clostridiaceae bacterium HSG29]|nr:DNA repair protein RadA [Clostridiaceae bacterium HSG29]